MEVGQRPLHMLIMVLLLVTAAAALMLSDIPWAGPVGKLLLHSSGCGLLSYCSCDQGRYGRR